MFEIVGKLRCPVCSKPVQMDEKVFLDIINTVIHQNLRSVNSHSRMKAPSKRCC